MNEPILQFFSFSHLPDHLKRVSQMFSGLANWIASELPRNPERTVALRKLLEAKDAAVRAVLFKNADQSQADGPPAAPVGVPPLPPGAVPPLSADGVLDDGLHVRFDLETLRPPTVLLDAIPATRHHACAAPGCTHDAAWVVTGPPPKRELSYSCSEHIYRAAGEVVRS